MSILPECMGTTCVQCPQGPEGGGCAEKGQRGLLGWKGQKWRDGSYQMEGTEVGSEDRLRTEKKRKEWY